MKADEGVIARRYARAAIMYLDEAGGHEDFARGMADLALACKEVPVLETVLATPIVSQNHKQQLATAVAAVLATPDSVQRLLRILIANNRVEYLDAILARFNAMLDEKHGRMRGKVVTAVELQPVARQRVAAALKSLFAKDVICTFEVDQTLYGGVHARVGNTVIDSSIKGKLAELKHRIMALSS
jgi:F-type H+-transporting ATPase subunit delta